MSSHDGHKTVRWVYCPGQYSEGMRVSLDANRSRHLSTVLRLTTGTAVIATNGHGTVFETTIEVEKKNIVLVIGNMLPSPPRTLGFDFLVGLPKNATMDFIIEKATELGVRSITPLIMSRSVVRPTATDLSKYQNRWLQIAADALEQSQQAWLPKIEAPLLFEKYTGAYFAFVSESRIQSTIGHALSQLREAVSKNGTFTFMIGPEGGFSRDERKQMAANGVRELSLGSGILRVETAVVSALTLGKLAISGQ